MKKRSSCLVAHAELAAGLRERLTREACAEDFVGRNLVLGLPNISMDEAMGIREVPKIELSKLVINFAGEDALVTETG